MTSKNKRWEIWIHEQYFDEFKSLLLEIDKTRIQVPLHNVDNQYWLVLAPSEEFKVLATLRFPMTIVNPYGTEVPLA